MASSIRRARRTRYPRQKESGCSSSATPLCVGMAILRSSNSSKQYNNETWELLESIRSLYADQLEPLDIHVRRRIEEATGKRWTPERLLEVGRRVDSISIEEEKGNRKRWLFLVSETREDLDAYISANKKDFLKTPCAHCGGSCKLAKKYKDTMAMIIQSLTDQFWCRDCGRVLCDQHRYCHTCERVDAEKEKRRNITADELRQQLEEAEARKEAMEAAKKEEERHAAEIIENQKLQRKDRRKLLASKAKHVENFIQQQARDPTGRPHRVHEDLLTLYPKASRISLALYNEFEHPSSQEVGGEDWEEIKVVYERARELTGMIIMTEDGPLDMRNPWDPPPAEEM